jgi:hypothetical protein
MQSKPPQRNGMLLKQEETLREGLCGRVQKAECTSLCVTGSSRIVNPTVTSEQFFKTSIIHGPLRLESASRRFELLQQPIKLFAHNPVTLAGDSLQAFAIYDFDPASRIFDYPSFL